VSAKYNMNQHKCVLIIKIISRTNNLQNVEGQNADVAVHQMAGQCRHCQPAAQMLPSVVDVGRQLSAAADAETAP